MRDRVVASALALMVVGASVAGCTSSSTNAAKSGGASASSGGPSGSAAASSGTTKSGTSGSTAGSAHASAPYPTPTGPVPKPVSNQSAVLAALPGSSGRGCVTVSARNTTLRSGDLAVGNFASARAAFAKAYGKTEAPDVTLYVIPRDVKSAHRASITLRPRKGAAHTTTSTSVEDANGYTYFIFTVSVRAAGTYTMTVTAGVDRGCYTVDFAK